MYVTSPPILAESIEAIYAPLAEIPPSQNMHTSTIRANQSLFFEGDSADYTYQILKGVVRSSKVLSDGRRQVLSFGYPGDIIGFSHDQFYHNDCKTLCETKVRIFHKNAFSAMLSDDLKFCHHMLKCAAAEVNHMQEHFLMLGRKSAMEKICSFLIALHEREGRKWDENSYLDLPMSRSDIADFLGLTIETVSRCLTKLRKENIIALPNPHRIHLSKPDTLRALAEYKI